MVDIELKNTLVLGGARSGKSIYAEKLVEVFGQGLYLATATAKESEDDNEMLQRILKHKKRRGKNWQTIEEPIDIVEVIDLNACSKRPILVDCLTLWLSNLMLAKKDVEYEVMKLRESLVNASGPLVLVSSEVGMGIVPSNNIAREFRDYAGYLHQKLANECKQVVFVVAGLPMIIKDE